MSVNDLVPADWSGKCMVYFDGDFYPFSGTKQQVIGYVEIILGKSPETNYVILPIDDEYVISVPPEAFIDTEQRLIEYQADNSEDIEFTFLDS